MNMLVELPIDEGTLTEDKLAALSDAQLRQFCEQLVLVCLRFVENKTGSRLPLPGVSFCLRGKAAGQYRYDKKEPRHVLRFNDYLLLRNREAFVREVIPHEVSHLVAYTLYGWRIKPHGPEWKGIMQEIFGLPPKVTHNFLVRQSSSVTYAYLCRCPERVHQLGKIRHRRITEESARYICNTCKTELIATH